MTTLPCRHEDRVTKQVRPTIDLLTNMDEWHPDVLLQHDIQPADYRGGLVFRSAIESIRGTFIASGVTGRQSMVTDVLNRLEQQKQIAGFQQTSSTQRYDFTIALRRDPDYFTVIEVKGGEGNSVNISERPYFAREFYVWCHLDGAIVNQPAHGAHAIINRFTNELVRRGKQVDAVFFKDVLCGTRARPCPKYPNREAQMGLLTAPDVFLFPQRIPSLNEPEPPVHTLETLRLPSLIFDFFDVNAAERARHIWEVRVKLVELTDGRLKRIAQLFHDGQVVDRFLLGKPWRPSE